jgi:ATP-dependent protease HslVU (ClpYQ) peptidase subunit
VTCVVAVEHEGSVWIGADSIAFDDTYDAVTLATPKVFIREGIIFGHSGGVRALQALKHGLKIPKRGTRGDDEQWICTVFAEAVRAAVRKFGATISKDGIDQVDGHMLVGYRGAAYAFEPGLAAIRSTRGFEAIGCGAKYALGNLHGARSIAFPPDVRISYALEAAEALNAGVRGPFTILRGGDSA